MKVIVKRDILEAMLYKRGLTSKDFAGSIGITSNTLSYILNGKRTPSQKTAKKIIDALDIPFEEIFEIKEG